MREVKIITIDLDDKTKRDFTVKELTVQHILDLSQNNSLLGGGTKDEPGTNLPGFTFVNKLTALKPDVEKIMKVSCDFMFDDLTPLAPSDIKKIYDGFQEVNQTFLDVLKSLGILEILENLITSFTKGFLGRRAT